MQWSNPRTLRTPCAANAVIVCLAGATAVATAQSVSFGITHLPVPPGCSSAVPTALNDVGQVVLICQWIGGKQTRSFLWADDEIRWIGEFRSGFVRHAASDINHSGQVVGTSWSPRRGPCAVLWQDGAPLADVSVFLDIGSTQTTLPDGRSFTSTLPLVHTHSDERGRFRVLGVRPGPRRILVRAPGLAPWRGEAEVAGRSSPVDDGEALPRGPLGRVATVRAALERGGRAARGHHGVLRARLSG